MIKGVTLVSISCHNCPEWSAFEYLLRLKKFVEPCFSICFVTQSFKEGSKLKKEKSCAFFFYFIIRRESLCMPCQYLVLEIELSLGVDFEFFFISFPDN